MKQATAAEMLDVLSNWIIEQIDLYPIRGDDLDLAIIRAEAESQMAALNVYRSTDSAESGLEAAKKVFMFELTTSHLAPADSVFARFAEEFPSPTEGRAEIHSVG